MQGFCCKCDCEVEFNILNQSTLKTIKGYEVEYERQEAFCSQCHQPIFNEALYEENQERAKLAYQERVSSETIELIEGIMKKYNIGKRPLSLILDWGELTVTRYLKGMVPKKEYLDLLKHIYKDSFLFSELLEKNKEKITRVAYSKCLKTLDEMQVFYPETDVESEADFMYHEEVDSSNQIMYQNQQMYHPNLEEFSTSSLPNEGKIFKVAEYVLCLSEDITPMALQKILYYAQAFFKVFYGYELFEDDCEAWSHGPVYPNIYDRFKDYRYVEGITFAGGLDEEEQFFIDLIMRYLGCYSGKALERMTHCEKPWREARRGVASTEKRGRVMDRALIESYFSDVYKKYNMLSITDIMDYSTALFSRIL